tara:strand:- start:228 stop:449 length:222 start_codon:yes stop_codon:yes gene_type:complete
MYLSRLGRYVIKLMDCGGRVVILHYSLILITYQYMFFRNRLREVDVIIELEERWSDEAMKIIILQRIKSSSEP